MILPVDQDAGALPRQTWIDFYAVLASVLDENQKDVINRQNGQGPKHLKFFLLVFAKDEAQAQAQEGPSPRSPSPNNEGQGQALNKRASFE